MLILLLTTLGARASVSSPEVAEEVAGVGMATEVMATEAVRDTTRRGGHHLRNKFLDGLYQFVKEFSRIDTNYVEPQHYNFQVMLQNTYTFDIYSLKNRQGQDVEFKQDETAKVGPYFGWRWIFLGYMMQLKGKIDEGKQELGFSLYSNQIGVDLFYRKSGDSYKINVLDLGGGQDLSYLKGIPFGGFETSIKGFNLYYIFNHRKFSYPAAYSMSTMQKRSAGSMIGGIGYTKHSLHQNWQAFDQLLQDHMGSDYYRGIIDTTLTTSDVSYTDYSVSAGYAYNWVFAPRFLLDVSVQGALAYKRSTAMSDRGRGLSRVFDLQNFNVDGIVRVGMVYNNNRWFAGANTIMHAYNYRRKQFSASTVFGNINVYVGFNFGRR